MRNPAEVTDIQQPETSLFKSGFVLCQRRQAALLLRLGQPVPDAASEKRKTAIHVNHDRNTARLQKGENVCGALISCVSWITG